MNYSEYQDALNYFYESESENEYFSALEYQGKNKECKSVKKDNTTIKRERSQREAQMKLAGSRDSLSKVVPPTPSRSGYTPPFNGPTASAQASEPPQKKVKRRQSSTADSEQPEPQKGSGRKAKVAPQARLPVTGGNAWSVAENQIAIINESGAIRGKYNEFKDSVVAANCSPLHPNFEKMRWNLKQTHQKNGYKLYSIRLSKTHRATFMVEEENKIVRMFSVGKHD